VVDNGDNSHGQDGGITINNSGYNDIYNNTVYSNSDGILLFETDVDNLTRNNNVKNNIIAENEALELRTYVDADDSSTTSLVLDYNTWYHSAGGDFMSWEEVAGTYAEYLTASSQGANSLNINPLFTDATNANFIPTKDSPADRAGTSVGLTVDYAGTAIEIAATPDIGAYEFTGSYGYESRYKRFSDFWRFKRH
jgi:parallel beta-helix repeat protein